VNINLGYRQVGGAELVRNTLRIRLIALLVITPLLLSSQFSTSHAAAKAGAKCLKVGSKSVVGSKTFTCIKSGNKMVWDRGVNKATLIPKTREEKAFELVRAAYLASPAYKAPITYVVAEKYNQRFFELIKTGTEASAKFFQNYYKPQSEIPLIMADGEDIDWMISSMSKYGHELDNFGRKSFSTGGYGNALTNGKSTILIYTGTPGKGKDIYAYGDMGFGAHEYVHVVTAGIVGKESKFGEVIPRWAYEGSASYFGNSIAELLPGKGELSQRPMKRKFKTFYESAKNFLVKSSVPILHSLSSQQLYDTFMSPEIDAGNCPSAYCYTTGQFLTEALIADYGIDTYISWWRASINTPWRSAFEKTFGVNFNQWLAEVGIPYVMDGANKSYPEQSAHPDYKKKIEFTKS
jgi:hypothetical protein